MKAFGKSIVVLAVLSVALSGCRRVTNSVSIKDPHGAKSYGQYEDAVVYDTVSKGGDQLDPAPSAMVLKDDRVQWHLVEHTTARHRWVAQPPKGARVFLHVQGRFLAKAKGTGSGGPVEPPEWRSLAIDIDLDADTNRNGKIDEEGDDNTLAEDSVEEDAPGAILCKQSELIVRKIKVDLTSPLVISATGKVIVTRSDARKFDIRRKADDPTTSIFSGNARDSLDFFDEVKSHDVRLWLVPLAREGQGDVRLRMDAKIQLKGRTESVNFRDRVLVYSMGFIVKKLTVWDKANPTVKATNPSDEHLVVCETDAGNAIVNMDIEIDPDDAARRARVLWQIDEATAAPKKGNFVSHPVPVTLTPTDGNRTYLLKVGCDQNKNNELDPEEIRRTMTIYVLKVTKLLISDKAHPTVKKENPSDTKIVICETAAGNAVAQLKAEFEPDNEYTRPRVLFRVEGDNASPAKGNFTTNPADITFTPTEENRTYTVNIGPDRDGNGELAEAEVTQHIVVDVLKVKTLTVSDKANPKVKAVNPSETHLVVCETAAGSATIEIKADFAPDNSDTKPRVRFLVEGDGAAPAQGNFETNPVECVLTPGDRTYKVQVGCDADANGTLETAEITHTITVDVLKLNKLTVSDNAQPKVKATNPSDTELFVAETAAGNAVIKLEAEFVPDNAKTKPRVLWLIEGNKAEDPKGNFVNASPTATLTPTGGNRTFIVKAGCDVNGNGTLDTDSDSTEVNHEITVTVIRLKIQSIEFTTDHNLMRNDGTDITTVGVRYPDVEWQPEATPAVNAPITHTASGTSKIAVKVTLDCDGAPNGLAFNLHGTSSESAFAFDKDDSFSGSSPKTATIDSTNPIGEDVRKFTATITWTASVGTTPLNFDLGSSGPHTVYTTLGTPDISAPASASVPTPERMDLAVPVVATAITAAGGHGNKPKIVWQIVKTRGTYYLGRNLTHPAGREWLLPSFATDPHPGADCISISRFVRNICMCMGVPGAFDAKTFMAKYATAANPNRPKISVEGTLAGVHPGDFGPPALAGLAPFWELGLADAHCVGGAGGAGSVGSGPNGVNDFEAAVVYTPPGGTTWYFPGGTNSHFTDVNKVVQIFQTLAWFAYQPAGPGHAPGFYVRAVDFTYTPPTDDPF